MSEWMEQIRDALDGQRLTVNRLDDGTAVLLDIEGERLMTLNSTALRLVDWIEQGISSPSGLTEKLCEQFDVEPERAEIDAREFVQTLAEALRV